MKGCDPGPVPTRRFSTVLARELEHIRKARAGGAQPEGIAGAKAQTEADKMELKALAFSGGGIRSATFNLGIIQALCEQRLLKCFDYLSTVSGGGYIGSWLSAQIHHVNDVDKVQAALSPTDPNARPKANEDKSIEFLRQYSNYLTPRRGLLSIDTLTAVATYVRNVLIIQSTLIALIVTVLLVPRVLGVVIDGLPGSAWEGAYFSQAGWTGLLLVVVAFGGIWLNIRARPTSLRARTPFVVWTIIVPTVLGAFALAVALSRATLFPWVPLLWVLVLAYAIVTALLALLPALHEHYALVVRREAPWDSAQAFLAAANARPDGSELRINTVGERTSGTMQRFTSRTRLAQQPFQDWERSSQGLLAREIDAVVVPRSRQRRLRVDREMLRVLPFTDSPSALRQKDRDLWIRLREAIAIFAFAFAAGLCGLLSLSLLQTLMNAMNDDATLFAVSVAPFLILQIFGLVVIVHLGLVGRIFDYQVHEWWARYGAWIIEMTVWAGGALAIAVYGPRLFAWALQYGGQTVAAAGGLVWVITTVWGVLKGASPTTSGTKTTWAERLLPLAPYVFILGLALALAYAIHPGLTSAEVAPVAFIVFLALYLLLSRRLDINLFSLHGFYRNRLTRCYLGGARMGSVGRDRRRPHPFTGFDPADDLEVHNLPARPYHIVNTTLNISAGKNLAWQQRKAASFFFSPLYCGFEFPEPEYRDTTGGFVKSADYMRDSSALGAASSRGAMLGSAMAVSGAALSPNGGFHTSRPVAFLLTLFNLRLGRWCPNPAHFPVPRRQAPKWGGWVLMRELLALTDSESPYVYLSDGGHFDNLGVYELVRRRASLIIAMDCGEDADDRFDDLADTIRKCYIDFGAKITLDVGPLSKAPPEAEPRGNERPGPLAALCKEHAVKGTIEYPALPEAGAFTGTLILVKPTLTTQIFKQAPDLLNYYLLNPRFPQQSTTNQWFNEAQFESYRKLGYIIGDRLLKEMRVNGMSLAEYIRS